MSRKVRIVVHTQIGVFYGIPSEVDENDLKAQLETLKEVVSISKYFELPKEDGSTQIITQGLLQQSMIEVEVL